MQFVLSIQIWKLVQSNSSFSRLTATVIDHIKHSIFNLSNLEKVFEGIHIIWFHFIRYQGKEYKILEKIEPQRKKLCMFELLMFQRKEEEDEGKYVFMNRHCTIFMKMELYFTVFFCSIFCQKLIIQRQKKGINY